MGSVIGVPFEAIKGAGGARHVAPARWECQRRAVASILGLFPVPGVCVPVYDYRCEKGHRFEAFQSMSDAPITKCEECGAPSQRVLHAPAIHFKGSGFHNTDYGTKKRPVGGSDAPATDKKSGSESSTASSGAASSDAGKSGGKTVGLDKA
jgi:putative FmdB family regulatory protein